MHATKNNIVRSGFYKRKKLLFFVLLLLSFLLLSLAFFMMIYGNTIYSPKTIFLAFFNQTSENATFTIKTLKLPRMLIAILSGFSFGLAGHSFQKLLGNPLASPDIIGITSGSSVAAVFSILILHLSGALVSIISLVSGILVSAFIYFISTEHGYSGEKIILTGIGINAFLNAIISWILLRASEYDVANALRWLNGSLNGVTMNQVPSLLLCTICSSFALLTLNQHLKVLQLGDSYAKSLGLKVSIIRLLIIFFSLLLIAFATSVTGPIASVAFLAGPIASRLSKTGTNSPLASAITGALLVMISDLIGQFMFSTRYPVGVITGILGAPYLIYLLLRMNKKERTVL